MTKVTKLALNVGLEMISIPGGTFMMGSHKGDPYRFSNEIPQHRVAVGEFWMGKYTITQAQWRVVASSLPQVERKLDPNPSYFEGDNRPVESVSWHDAMEFCARLSVHTQQTYTLPSEAQWEYACLAGTTRPFHISETITPDLANYKPDLANYKSDNATYRQETTEVGNFPPNPFGLYDMHGNVWEWCQDHWHESYNGAPADGSAWITGGESNLRMLRGGSWVTDLRGCRSACRLNSNPDNRYDSCVGFRVVSVPPRALG